MERALDVRFRPEAELVGQLFERFGLQELIEHFVRSGGLRSVTERHLATRLRLTPVLSPRLCGLLDEAKACVGFEEPVDLFVYEDALVNAETIHAVEPGRPHLLSLTSGLVERMADDEVRFVLGHELGHLHFEHSRSLLAYPAVGEDEEGTTRMPPLLHRRLQSWGRLAELSADRVGFAAAGFRLEPVVSAFFKLLSGLGPQHLRFDVSAFLEQLGELQRGRRDLYAGFTHPVTPVRVRALQLFSEAHAAGLDAASLAEVDRRVADLASLMDFEATEPLHVHARDFLLAGGLLAAHAGDDTLDDGEFDVLAHWLLPYCADPEAQIEQVETLEQAHALLDASVAWLTTNAGGERFALYEQLTHLVALDGRLSAEEQQFLAGLAEALGIPANAARDTLYETLSGYIAERKSRPRLPTLRPA